MPDGREQEDEPIEAGAPPHRRTPASLPAAWSGVDPDDDLTYTMLSWLST